MEQKMSYDDAEDLLYKWRKQFEKEDLLDMGELLNKVCERGEEEKELLFEALDNLGYENNHNVRAGILDDPREANVFTRTNPRTGDCISVILDPELGVTFAVAKDGEEWSVAESEDFEDFIDEFVSMYTYDEADYEISALENYLREVETWIDDEFSIGTFYLD